MIKIKKIIIAAALLSGLNLPSFGQVGEPRNNISLGFNGGLNMNNATFQPKIKQNMMMGAVGGFTARYISEKYFSMICGAQVEFNFSQRGWDELFEAYNSNNEIVEDNSRTYTRKLSYLEIPFLAHLAFGKDVGAQVFLNLGPQIALLLNDSETKTGDWTNKTLSETQVAIYNKKIDNKFDYGIVGGLGVELRTRKAGHFLLEGRYYFALSDFMNTTKRDYFSRAAHTTISARITYLFDIKK